MAEMGAKPNVRFCARWQAGLTEVGRKRNDRFGESGPEKRTASYRPNTAAHAAVGATPKRPFVRLLANSTRGGSLTVTGSVKMSCR
ncbi:hypothetical protein SAMN02799622_01802 [Methylobacterium sp. UNC378MF]|nr:hypothetical protein SAMN02799622_01802 [Methylobacterium sp. UNC378MF]